MGLIGKPAGIRLWLWFGLTALPALFALPASAVIFGENNLTDLLDRGATSQCDFDLGEETTSAGKFFGIRDGFRFALGSGATVGAKDIVVTSAHNFADSGHTVLQSGDRVIFAIYEKIGGTCQRTDYEITDLLADINLGTLDPDNDPESDFAIVRLPRPVEAYEPMEIPPPAMVEGAIQGKYPLSLDAFPDHPSVHNGDYLTVVSCQENVGDTSGTKRHWSENWVFIFDCDTWGGSSGGPLSIVQSAKAGALTQTGQTKTLHRFFIGLVTGHAFGRTDDGRDIKEADLQDEDRFDFDPQRNFNYATALSPIMRSRLRRAVAESQARAAQPQ